MPGRPAVLEGELPCWHLIVCSAQKEADTESIRQDRAVAARGQRSEVSNLEGTYPKTGRGGREGIQWVSHPEPEIRVCE